MNFWNPQNPIDHPYCYCLYHVLKWKSLSRVWLFGTPWTIQSMEFSRPKYWSGNPFPSPGDLPNTGIKPRSPTLQADSLPAETPGTFVKLGHHLWYYYYLNFRFYLGFAIFSNQFFFSSRTQLRNNIESTSPGSFISSCLWQFLSLSSFFIVLKFWGILVRGFVKSLNLHLSEFFDHCEMRVGGLCEE